MKSKLLTLIAFSATWLACANYNSSTSDDLEYVEVTANDDDQNFARAFSIIKNKCANCHQQKHQQWYSFNSNQQWIESGLIVKSSAATSLLITKLYNNGPPGNMPTENDLPNADYEFLKKWIDEMP
jgi:hypothetical protein